MGTKETGVETEVAIGLGSNLGDRLNHLRFGVRRLRTVLEGLRCSGVYETAPEGVTDQPAFLNACCTGRTRLSARQLLAELKDAERAAGRRPRARDGPRELDLDVLLYADSVIEELGLVVPHPRFRERAFVLVPLAEIAADWVVPGGPDQPGLEVRALASRASDEGITRTDLSL
jgi:2-amino-4-hydroxy-6-hydroxymethyldihydropteridine diphosphokinase